MNGTRIPERVATRASERFTLKPDTGCHISTYSVGSHGYAQIGWSEDGERTVTLVHRVVWAAQHGPIPPGITVDHMCKERRCCNIQHLRLLTNYENARRTDGRDWPVGRCIQGHPNSELVTTSNGKRVCAICRRAWHARYDAKKRASA